MPRAAVSPGRGTRGGRGFRPRPRTPPETPRCARSSRPTWTKASRFGFTGTPGFLINGVALMGAHPIGDFEQIINRHLAMARSR